MCNGQYDKMSSQGGRRVNYFERLRNWQRVETYQHPRLTSNMEDKARDPDAS
jgi:hypothetical protein